MSTWGIFQGDKPFSNPFKGRKGKLQKQIDELIKNRPEYKIAGEYGQNQAMAFANVMGRDAGVIQQEENIDQGVSDALGEAQNYSTNTGAILSTLAGLYNNKNKALRDLAVDEAAINRAKRSELYATNTAMAEEKDKAWNFNVNQPYQLKLAQLVGKQKHRRELAGKGVDAVASIATLGMSKLFGGGGGASGSGSVANTSSYAGYGTPGDWMQPQ